MKSTIRLAALVAMGLGASANAAVLINNEVFNTATANEAQFVATYPLFGYTELLGSSNVRSQNNPFGNGGTAFIAAVAGDEQTLTIAASGFGGPTYDTTTTLSLNADMAKNFDNPLSGLLVGGLTGDFIITWAGGSSTYNAGTWAGTGNGIPTGTVNGGTLTGGVAFPTGTALAPVNLSVIENGANYDLTLTVGGNANNFSVAIASLGAIDEIGYYNNSVSADGGSKGNTNIDNLTLIGEVIPEPSALVLLGLGGLALLRRRRP